jgi:hypothetical protein
MYHAHAHSNYIPTTTRAMSLQYVSEEPKTSWNICLTTRHAVSDAISFHLEGPIHMDRYEVLGVNLKGIFLLYKHVRRRSPDLIYFFCRTCTVLPHINMRYEWTVNQLEL